MHLLPLVIVALALAGFVAQTVLLGEFAPGDAAVAIWAAAARGCDPAAAIARFTRASPWGGAALLALATVIAWRRRVSRARIAWVLVMFGLSLFGVEALKLLFERTRPDAVTWAPAGASYPSGHVANAALSAAAAWALVRAGHRRPARDPLPSAVALLGALFVAAVAASRIYLGRHWLTDVSASVLLAALLAGLTALPRRPAVAAALLAAVAFTSSGLALAAASGAHVPLPSPSTLERRPQFHVALSRPRARARAGLAGVWLRRNGYLRLFTTDFSATVPVRDGRQTLLRIVMRPLRRLRGACRWLHVRLGDMSVGRVPLRRGWSAYAFPLPPMAPGPHRIVVRVDGAAPVAPGATLGLRALRVDPGPPPRPRWQRRPRRRGARAGRERPRPPARDVPAVLSGAACRTSTPRSGSLPALSSTAASPSPRAPRCGPTSRCARSATRSASAA